MVISSRIMMKIVVQKNICETFVTITLLLRELKIQFDEKKGKNEAQIQLLKCAIGYGGILLNKLAQVSFFV